MLEVGARSAIIFASGMEKETISRQFAPEEEGTLLDYVLDSVWTVADEMFVVFDHEPDLQMIESLSPFGVKILSSKGENPVITISNAFKSAKSEHCLLVTERVPLLKPNVVLSLFENAVGYDLAIPRWKGGKTEPMLAAYRRNAFTRLVSTWKSKLGDNVEKDISTLAQQLFAVKYIPIETELQELDPELDSFLKVTDKKSLQMARSKASIRGKARPKKAR
jgi:molybdopterin-guanine dinucleotide biosynthesis protein A